MRFVYKLMVGIETIIGGYYLVRSLRFSEFFSETNFELIRRCTRTRSLDEHLFHNRS